MAMSEWFGTRKRAAEESPVGFAAVVPRSREEQEKAGWVSPRYSQCREISLDPEGLAARRVVALQAENDELEHYRVLRTQILQRTKEQGGNAIMVTSAVPGEGKTLTAINLALSFAKEFRETALLVDCDLKRQAVRKTLGFSHDKGLVDYLLFESPVSELMVWPGLEKFTVISGGRTIHDSSELLGSKRMRELVAELKGRYPDRYVFFDAPPLLSGADALAMIPLVDHVLVVVRAAATSLKDVSKALELLPKEKIFGLVLNAGD
ncbi:MAG: AAA family ATPase [Deltaproteobacteria bacterium]|nr:AAA family ATPase [Deltaproteobacteria bacterium]